jgi:hypothetical protein
MLPKRKEPKRKSMAETLIYLGTLIECLLVLPSGDPARAHSWYPRQCCGGEDCRKVDKIDFLPSGDMVMHVGWIKVVVPRNFVKQPSQDADAHVCMSIATGTFRPVCVFMPGTS